MEISRIRAVQMNNLRGLFGIRKMDRLLNVQIRELCGVTKGLDDGTDESVRRRFDNIERMRKDRKPRKSRSEEKVVGLAHPPYFPQGNGRHLSKVEPGE